MIILSLVELTESMILSILDQYKTKHSFSKDGITVLTAFWIWSMSYPTSFIGKERFIENEMISLKICMIKCDKLILSNLYNKYYKKDWKSIIYENL